MILRPWRALQIEMEHSRQVERRLRELDVNARSDRMSWQGDRQKLLDRLRAANEWGCEVERQATALEGKVATLKEDLRKEQEIAERTDEAYSEATAIDQSRIRGLECVAAQRRDIIAVNDRRLISMAGTIRKLQSSGAKARARARKAEQRVAHLEAQLAEVRPSCTVPALTDCQYDPENIRQRKAWDLRTARRAAGKGNTREASL